jgi:hypothetical protein
MMASTLTATWLCPSTGYYIKSTITRYKLTKRLSQIFLWSRLSITRKRHGYNIEIS